MIFGMGREEECVRVLCLYSPQKINNVKEQVSTLDRNGRSKFTRSQIAINYGRNGRWVTEIEDARLRGSIKKA